MWSQPSPPPLVNVLVINAGVGHGGILHYVHLILAYFDDSKGSFKGFYGCFKVPVPAKGVWYTFKALSYCLVIHHSPRMAYFPHFSPVVACYNDSKGCFKVFLRVLRPLGVWHTFKPFHLLFCYP